MIKGIDIAAYLVRDPQAQIAFYRDVLGMEPTEIDDQGRGAEFTPRRRLDVRRLEARR
jgi:catechol 2,3-dioxygenase-like lactoylglutathione lyase family enzyme